MRLISKRARDEVNLGDMVITSGVGGVYPAAVYPGGISIGRVSKINYQEYETSMEAELESAIDFSRLEYVFVIDPYSGYQPGEGEAVLSAPPPGFQEGVQDG
jgi:rod shape-determining protein MreC